MVKVVWKFQIKVDSKIEVIMPKGAEILTVQTQDFQPCIWALVNPEAEEETRTFYIAGTGENIYYHIGMEYKYINTFQLRGGLLVFHLFELTKS